MMIHPDMLLARLDAIGHALEKEQDALALIGLGSVGQELDRLDEFSDLDFFVVVEDGAKQRYLDQLGWLAAAGPIAYSFRNTDDGYKVLYADGIFCEFAVFTQTELAAVAFTAPRMVWQRLEFALPHASAAGAPGERGTRERAWLVGEALTNLYVGLGRMHRGELLSASRFIQQYAVDRTIELASHLVAARQVHADPFALERRVEQRFPEFAQHLPEFVQGYTRNRESALALLAFLESHAEVDPVIAGAIRDMAARGSPVPAQEG